MTKNNRKLKEHSYNQLIHGVVISIIFIISLLAVGCIDDTADVCGTYTYSDCITLIVYENNTFLSTERLGYLMGREVNMSVRGTYTRDEDIIIFSGDCVITTAHMRGGNLIMNGNKYIKASQ